MALRLKVTGGSQRVQNYENQDALKNLKYGKQKFRSARMNEEAYLDCQFIILVEVVSIHLAAFKCEIN